MENSWLNENIIKKVKSVYEARYNHPVTDKEAEEIAVGLASLMEIYTKFKWRKNGKNIYPAEC